MVLDNESKTSSKRGLTVAIVTVFLLGCAAVAVYETNRGASTQLGTKSAVTRSFPACAAVPKKNRVQCYKAYTPRAICEGRGCCAVNTLTNQANCYLPMDDAGAFVVVPRTPVNGNCTVKGTSVFYKYAQLRALMDLNIAQTITNAQLDAATAQIVQPTFQIAFFGQQNPPLVFTKEKIRTHEQSQYSEVHHFCSLVSVIGCTSSTITINVNVHSVNKDVKTGDQQMTQDIEAVTWKYNNTIKDYLLSQIIVKRLPIFLRTPRPSASPTTPTAQPSTPPTVKVGPKNCSDIEVFNKQVWGESVNGVFIKRFTKNELQFIGCISKSCSGFTCIDVNGGIRFGSNGGPLVALLGPGPIPSNPSYISQGCQTNWQTAKLGVKAAPTDPASVTALCNQLGYAMGSAKTIPQSFCPTAVYVGGTWTDVYPNPNHASSTQFTCSYPLASESIALSVREEKSLGQMPGVVAAIAGAAALLACVVLGACVWFVGLRVRRRKYERVPDGDDVKLKGKMPRVKFDDAINEHETTPIKLT